MQTGAPFSFERFTFPDLKTLLAKASPLRSGDVLAGLAASSDEERVAARFALADVPLKQFLSEALVPYEDDDVTRMIIDDHDADAFAPVSSMTVGDFRNWLLTDDATPKRSGIWPRPDTRNGRCGIKTDAQSGPDCGSQEMPRGHRLS